MNMCMHYLNMKTIKKRLNFSSKHLLITNFILNEKIAKIFSRYYIILQKWKKKYFDKVKLQLNSSFYRSFNFQPSSQILR